VVTAMAIPDPSMTVGAQVNIGVAPVGAVDGKWAGYYIVRAALCRVSVQRTGRHLEL
jgi:hypothetical protein